MNLVKSVIRRSEQIVITFFHKSKDESVILAKEIALLSALCLPAYWNEVAMPLVSDVDSFMEMYMRQLIDELLYLCLTWIGILAMLGLGKRFLNHDWKFTRHFVKAEFSIYLFHQTVVILVGYLLIPRVESVYMQYFLIVVLSFIVTYLLYQICRRFKVTRFLFAIKG